jgi:hypothetical protein
MDRNSEQSGNSGTADGTTRERMRSEINEQIEEFLRRGGRIDVVGGREFRAAA